MNDSEAIAKAVIEFLMPGAVMQYCQQQAGGEHDFDLTFADGQIAPLEVTVSTDEGLKEMEAALHLRRGGFFVQTKECRQDWIVFPAIRANVSRIRMNVDHYLAQIEEEGRDSFSANTDAHGSRAVKQILVDLRIEAGRVTRGRQSGQIVISLPIQETVFDPEHFLHAVESEASKPDNLRKLGSSRSPQRHLLVYIEHDNFAAWHAINNAPSPLRLQSIPAEITHVWAVASSYESDRYVAWKASATEPWTYAGVVMLNSNQIQLIRDAAD